MAPHSDAQKTGGRLTGIVMRDYMQEFSKHFLLGKIRFNTEVVNIRRDDAKTTWFVSVQAKETGMTEVMTFTRLVLCTGVSFYRSTYQYLFRIISFKGCSTPNVPKKLCASAARLACFNGPVIHAMDFQSQLEQILSKIHPVPSKRGHDKSESIVIVGGSKSAQE